MLLLNSLVVNCGLSPVVPPIPLQSRVYQTQLSCKSLTSAGICSFFCQSMFVFVFFQQVTGHNPLICSLDFTSSPITEPERERKQSLLSEGRGLLLVSVPDNSDVVQEWCKITLKKRSPGFKVVHRSELQCSFIMSPPPTAWVSAGDLELVWHSLRQSTFTSWVLQPRPCTVLLSATQRSAGGRLAELF